jgi:hypothetical protein
MINYKSIGIGIAGAVAAGAGLFYTAGNPLDVGEGNAPTHFNYMDIDEDGNKDDFALGYNTTQKIDLYLHTDNGFQHISTAKNSNLVKAINTRNEVLQSAEDNHTTNLETTQNSTANIKARLRRAQADSE